MVKFKKNCKSGNITHVSYQLLILLFYISCTLCSSLYVILLVHHFSTLFYAKCRKMNFTHTGTTLVKSGTLTARLIGTSFYLVISRAIICSEPQLWSLLGAKNKEPGIQVRKFHRLGLTPNGFIFKISHFNLVCRFKWAMSGLFTIRYMDQRCL